MNLPPGTKRTTRPRSPRRALAAAPPAAAPPPAYFTLHPTRPPFSSATRDEAEKFLHVPSWILNKNTAAAAGAAPPPPPRAPGPARRGRSLPGDCGGEPLLAAAAPGARRPSSSRQQSQKEEVPRSRRAPRSAAISSLRAAAAAAAPRSPRRSASRALQPVPRCRLGSRGRRRRCSSPARPGPRGPSRGRGHSGAPPSCRGAERGGERRVSTFRGGGAGGSVSRFQAPPPAADSGSTHQREGGGDRRRRGWGAGARGAHTRARASARLPRPHALGSARGPPRSNPGCRLAGPLPSPFSPEPRTGAGRARLALLLASGKPRRSGSSFSSSRLPAAPVPRAPSSSSSPWGEIPLSPPQSPAAVETEGRGPPSPGLSGRPQRERTSPLPGPRASI